jgi:hypothetical protein
MEPRPDEKKDQQPRPEAQPAKPRRFRVVKLEERIAPKGPMGPKRSLGYFGDATCLNCYTIPPGHCM